MRFGRRALVNKHFRIMLAGDRRTSISKALYDGNEITGHDVARRDDAT